MRRLFSVVVDDLLHVLFRMFRRESLLVVATGLFLCGLAAVIFLPFFVVFRLYGCGVDDSVHGAIYMSLIAVFLMLWAVHLRERWLRSNAP
jgi:hypothetical protein